MTSSNSNRMPSATPMGGEVGSLAERVLRELAVARADGSGHARPDIVLSLCMAVKDFDPNARRDWISEVRRLGVGADSVCQTYIPAAARVLGDQWCSDQLSFADVTIGVARLQGVLRDLMPESELVPSKRSKAAATVLMVVPDGEYHTLGAMVAARSLRQKGVSVKLAMDKSLHDIRAMVTAVDFDAVLISVSTAEKLEQIRQFILNIRQAGSEGLPILLGGSILDTHVDVKTLTGADYVDTDPIKALRACGLKVSSNAVLFPQGQV